MGSANQDKNQPGPTNETHIGSVTGQVHTGSGDIRVSSFTTESTVSSRDEFLDALRAFKKEIDAARQQGLPDDTSDDVIVEVEAVERELEKDKPTPGRIVQRLENAKALLVSGTGVASAAGGAATAINNLLPQLETAIQTVGKIFGL
jgi:hypothetical protein